MRFGAAVNSLQFGLDAVTLSALSDLSFSMFSVTLWNVNSIRVKSMFTWCSLGSLGSGDIFETSLRHL